MRAFNPTREQHGYEPLGSVLETNTDDWPFLVDSVSAALEARGERGRAARCTRSSASSARGRAGSPASRHPRDAIRRESVMHFDLARRLDDAELAELEDDVRGVLARRARDGHRLRAR